jgi:hypothetical protein
MVKHGMIFRLKRSDFSKFLIDNNPCPTYITKIERLNKKIDKFAEYIRSEGKDDLWYLEPDSDDEADIGFFLLIGSSWPFKNITESSGNVERQARIPALAATLEGYAVDTYRGMILDQAPGIRQLLTEIMMAYCIDVPARGIWPDGIKISDVDNFSETPTKQVILDELREVEEIKREDVLLQKLVSEIEKNPLGSDPTGKLVTKEVAEELTVLCKVNNKFQPLMFFS